MTPHLPDAVHQAWLDNELDAEARAAAEQHLRACADCAAALAELRAARETFAAAVARLDAPAPVASALLAVRGRGWRRAGVATHRALLRAAMLVLGVAGVAAASVPGSPVRAFISRLAAPAAPAPTAPTLSTEAPRRVATAPAVSGVSVLPAAGRVRIVLVAPDRALRLRVRVWEGEAAEVTAPRGPNGPRFRTRAGELEVVGAGDGEALVQLPRSARSAVVEADGEVLAVAEAGRLRALRPASGAGNDRLFRLRR